jgi:hypothetical protein
MSWAAESSTSYFASDKEKKISQITTVTACASTYHSSCRVENCHVLQNCCTIIGDNYLSVAGLDLLENFESQLELKTPGQSVK